jgi:hypothetical protein
MVGQLELPAMVDVFLASSSAAQGGLDPLLASAVVEGAGWSAPATLLDAPCALEGRGSRSGERACAVMNCQSFDSSLLDALYDELDAETSRAMDEHATTCPSCAARLAAMQKTRMQVAPALELPIPDGLEARILAAAEAAEAANHAPAPSAERQPRPRGIVAFLFRPQLAIAASLLLVVGASALFLGRSAKREAAPAAIAAPPAADQAEGRAVQEPAPRPAPVVVGAAPATATAVAPTPTATIAAASAVASTAPSRAKAAKPASPAPKATVPAKTSAPAVQAGGQR